MALGLLVLLEGAISADEIAKNFNVDRERFESELQSLEERGLATCVEGGYYEATTEGRERVTTRGNSSSVPAST